MPKRQEHDYSWLHLKLISVHIAARLRITWALLFLASFIYEQRPIGRCGPRGQNQQRPRGSQPSCDMDADQL